MCGRFTQDIDTEDYSDLYNLHETDLPEELTSRWNGAPTQSFAVYRANEEGQRTLKVHRWGLIPSWAKDPAIGSRLINARSETVASKPSFRSAFRRRRCLIPANGWFEWQKVPAGKQPWWISLGKQPFSFGGLWEFWHQGQDRIATFTILTCESSGTLAEIHNRQPAIISRSDYDKWLNPAMPESGLLEMVQVPHQGPFDCRRVSSEVNSPRNDHAGILMQQDTERKRSLRNWLY